MVSPAVAAAAAALFNFWAAGLVNQDIKGWEIVQAGVVFVGICYTLGAIALLEVASRVGRKVVA